MLGFYTAFAKTYQHEPQLSLLGFAFSDQGRYYFRFRRKQFCIDVVGTRLRTKEWFDIKKPHARSDVLNDAYYQWLYIREMLALNYEIIVPRVLESCTERELALLNQLLRLEYDRHPHLPDVKLMRFDDKYFYFGLAYSRRVFPSLGTAVEVPVFVDMNDFTFRTDEKRRAARQAKLPATWCEAKFDLALTETAKYVSVYVQPGEAIEVDMIMLPLPSPATGQYASLSLISTDRPWSLIIASTRRLPSGELITVAPQSARNRLDWVLPLILLAYGKSYFVSVAALLLQKQTTTIIDQNAATNALKNALFSRVSLSGLDLPKAPSSRLYQLMNSLSPEELFRDFVSDRANVMAEYIYGYQRSLAILRWAAMRQDFVISLPTQDRGVLRNLLLGPYYALNNTTASDRRESLFQPVELREKALAGGPSAPAGYLLADEQSLTHFREVKRNVVMMSDMPIKQTTAKDKARADYVQQALEAGVPMVTLQYKGVYNDILPKDSRGTDRAH
jgi:hypothetical protein